MKRTKLSEVCYYAGPIPSVGQTSSLTPYTLQRKILSAVGCRERYSESYTVQSVIPVTIENLEKEITMIDAKLRELQQVMTERKEFEHSTPRQQTTTTRQ